MRDSEEDVLELFDSPENIQDNLLVFFTKISQTDCQAIQQIEISAQMFGKDESRYHHHLPIHTDIYSKKRSSPSHSSLDVGKQFPFP